MSESDLPMISKFSAQNPVNAGQVNETGNNALHILHI